MVKVKTNVCIKTGYEHLLTYLCKKRQEPTPDVVVEHSGIRRNSIGVLAVLFIMLPMALAGDGDVSVDIAKRIPVLTETNWTDWSWRVINAMKAIGTIGTVLYMTHASGTNWSSPTRQDVDNNDEVKEALKEQSATREAYNMAGGDDQKQAKEDLSEARVKVREARETAAINIAHGEAAQLSPFSTLSNTQAEKIFRLLVTTVSPSMDFLVRDYDAESLHDCWMNIRDYFVTNTRGTRNELKKEFFDLTMKPDQNYAQFKAEIVNTWGRRITVHQFSRKLEKRQTGPFLCSSWGWTAITRESCICVNHRNTE
jgi:hypothetical protein